MKRYLYIFYAIFLMCFAGSIFGQTVVTYSTPGTTTWICPVGVTSVTLKLWGGGGGGDLYQSAFASGGGGAFLQTTSIPVQGGATYNIIVGGGGIPNGGASSFGSVGSNPIVSVAGGTLITGAPASSGNYVEASYPGGNGLPTADYFSTAGGGAAGNTCGAGANGSASGGGTGQCGGGSGAYDYPGLGGFPGGGGAANWGFPGPFGGKGQVILTFTCNAGSGIIGNGHTVAYPPEMVPDSITNISSPAFISGLAFTWQESLNGTSWGTAAKTAETLPAYRFDQDNLQATTWYRRGNNACIAAGQFGNWTDPVQIKVFSQANSLLNGTISGRVTSTNATGVSDISITVQKTIALKGSSISKTYTTTTDGSGNYTIPNIFYGDLNNGDPNAVVFTNTPSKTNHNFTPVSSTATLSNTNPTSSGNNFTDNTVYSVSGVVTQTCGDCVPGFTADSINGIKITATKLNTIISYISLTGSNGFGKYGINLTDPGTYNFVPSYLNHSFTPANTTVIIVNDDVADLNFNDIATHVISGVFRAGCNENIGIATLEFTDTVTGSSGPKFKKQVTTLADGSYSISLPARKYKVQVMSFTPANLGNDITVNDLLTFFNTTAKDSLISSIDTADATLNLIYHRPPILQIANLNDTTCSIPGFGSYTLFKQNIPRTFIINVFEGDISHACKIATDTNKIKLITNVHGDDVNQTLNFSQANGSDTVTISGGSPNIISPYMKYFNLTYTDKYGRIAVPITRNVVVTGIKTDPGTFTTVSPQIPLLILHDPPGDNSFSFWQADHTTESAMRFFASDNTNIGGWLEVKIGVALIQGFGISIESSVWGSINASLGVSATVNNATEAIISTTNSQYYSTAGNSTITGNAGDVYIGAALNLLYSIGHELKYTGPCTLGIENKLAVADSGFATTYAYSEDHIVNSVIPGLLNIAANSTGAEKDKYNNQISVWQQAVNNNAQNKARATFDKNISFDGTIGPITSTTSTSSTRSNTIEFNLEINEAIAIQLGFEIAGSGVSGGVNIGFKTETGSSTTNTVTAQTTTGYTIDDDDDGDYFSIDVKKDPVYNTPVFVLVAGTASCPPEPVAQKRDACQLLIPQPVISGIADNGEALFQLHLGNISESNEPRAYKLSLVDGSNPHGAIVTIGGTPAVNPRSYTIPYLGDQLVTVSVKKSGASSVYSYEGLQFVLTDACDESVSKSNTISAYFLSPCSNVTLATPANNWIVNLGSDNILPVQFNGYTLNNLQSVSLEYAPAGTSNWVTDSTIFQNFITDPNSTIVNWDVSGLANGRYDIRLKLICNSGTVYSTRVSGTIDREAPSLFGIPEPTNDKYVTGNIISFSYSENIDNRNLNNNMVEMRKMSDNSIIPVQVSGFQNKIVITPLSNITSLEGENMRVIVSNISDVYGNIKVRPDSSWFSIGTSVTGTGPTALNLSLVKPAVFENSNDSMEVRFVLASPATNNILINYTISGTATYNNDYTVSYSVNQPLTTSFNGAQGTIEILKNFSQAVLKIRPVGDALFELDETITISLAEGGDYLLGNSISKTDTIKNDDHTSPIILASGSTTICNGGSLTLTTKDSIDGQPVYAYLWTGGGNNQILPVSTPGIYTVTVFTSNGFSGVSAPLEVKVSNTDRPSIGPDTTVFQNCVGDITNLLSLFNTTGLTALWDTPIPTVAPTGTYKLVVTNAAGCTDTAFAKLVIEEATWTGAISADWHTGGNWNTGKVPTSLTHVIIPAGTAYNCTISAANAQSASIRLRNGAIVQAINNKTLAITGNCSSLPPD
ncbi:MAG: carboxypeptidase-like regulatory domain-containing protein [Ferruginibacter sp.]